MLRYVVLVTHFVNTRTYGIGLVEQHGHSRVLLEAFPDLSHSRTAAARLVKACNRAALDPSQLRDVVKDFLAGL